MNHIFRNIARKFLLVFFDDILIYSPTWDSHLEHLRFVFSVLRQEQLFLKRSKCTFGATTIEYLGHAIAGIVVACWFDRREFDFKRADRILLPWMVNGMHTKL